MKKIAKLLKADINGTSDLASIAAMLANKGRGNDTLLAHITPREAEILKAAGGSGTTNPETGLLEFFETYEQEAGQFEPGGFYGNEAAQYEPIYQPIYQSDFEAMPASQAEFAQAQQATDAYSGGGLRATPAAYTEPVTSIQPLRFGNVEGVRATTPSAFGPEVPAVPKLGYGVTDKFTPTAAQETTTPLPEKSFFDKLSTQDMVRLGLAGGLGLYGSTQAKRGAKQAEQAAAEQRALAQPYQAKGRELIRAAETGELTPTGQQSLQALQARTAQGAQARGGIGVAQAAAQAEAYRQQLLSQQYNLGLQVSNIGDQIALGAIKTGLAADQALSQASSNFYTNLAAIGAGIPIRDTRTA